jgi:predicted DNA binding CopG/RHH family protein
MRSFKPTKATLADPLADLDAMFNDVSCGTKDNWPCTDTDDTAEAAIHPAYQRPVYARSNIMKRKAKTLAKLPRLKTDLEAEQFIAGSDLTRYDLSVLETTRFEFAAKEARINMRLPSELLSAVKRAARQRGVPYQRFIRQTLERAIKE